jgi:signal transduction histidine kinase/CHASE3 domain sensor protein
MTARAHERAAGSVGLRLRVAFGLLLVFLLLAGTVGIVALTAQVDQANEVVDRIGPLHGSVLQARQALTDAETGARGYLMTGDPSFLGPFDRGRAEFPVRMRQARAGVEGRTQVTASLDRMAAAGNRWLFDFAQPAVEARRRGVDGPDQRVGKLLFDQFRVASLRTDGVLASEDAAGRAEIIERAEQTRAALLVTMALGTAFGAIIAAYTTRGIVGPLERLRATMTRLRGADPDARAELEGATEIRAVASALNSLADENAALGESQRERVERERTIREIAGRVREHLDMTSVLERTVSEVGAALGVQRVLVRPIHDGHLGPVAAEWAAPGVDRVTVDGVAMLTAAAVSPALGSVAIEDVDRDERLDLLGGRSHLTTAGVKAALMTPVAGSALLVAHELRGPRAWSESDVGLIEAVARELAGALSHAQAYERERHMVAKLQELDNAKTEFVSSVSHELRTPLTSIVGYLELLTDEDGVPLEPSQARMVEVIERNSRRLLALIEDLLTLSRIESGAFKVSLALVELPPLVAAVIEAIRPSIDSRQLELMVDLPERMPPVQGDAAQLERVLANLLTNAAKFTPPGGRVTVSGQTVGDHVALSVADTGIGIPEAEQPKLFSRFFRSSISQEQAIQGTGLGLVIVKSVVEHHGGSIWFTSRPGAGSTFTVSLPAAAGEVDAAAQQPLALGPATGPSVREGASR